LSSPINEIEDKRQLFIHGPDKRRLPKECDSRKTIPPEVICYFKISWKRV
jgi:hypothetical protein